MYDLGYDAADDAMHGMCHVSESFNRQQPRSPPGPIHISTPVCILYNATPFPNHSILLVKLVVLLNLRQDTQKVQQVSLSTHHTGRKLAAHPGVRVETAVMFVGFALNCIEQGRSDIADVVYQGRPVDSWKKKAQTRSGLFSTLNTRADSPIDWIGILQDR
jgi:sorbitol-specific phosphotransferase system component IIA